MYVIIIEEVEFAKFTIAVRKGDVYMAEEKKSKSLSNLKGGLKNLASNLEGAKSGLEKVTKSLEGTKDSLSEVKDNITLENVISTAIQVPGVKVNREAFLREQFKDAPDELLNLIIEKGPVEAKCPREKLKKMADKLIGKRTVASTAASFIAGIPGGLAMAATIPADMLQFYGVALGLAQELSYLYGEPDLWDEGILNRDKVTSQLILYCGVMLGASGAAQTVRVLSSSLAKQALKKIPQQALTKTFYYPIIKSIAKFFGANMTKKAFAEGVSKAVPIIGGVVSGGLTFASMLPMGNRLVATLDEAHFEYSENDFEADWKVIMAEYETADKEVIDKALEIEAVEVDVVAVDETDTAKNFPVAEENSEQNPGADVMLEKITKAKQMLDAGIITEEEFITIKARILSE